MTPLCSAALRLAAAGFSPVPAGSDKRPVGSWKRNQERIDPPHIITAKFDRNEDPHRVTSIAVICGRVSGGLLVFDFDADKRGEAVSPYDVESDFLDPWLEGIASVVDIAALPQQRTRSDGRQAVVRCSEPGRNTKLAGVPAHNDQERITVIETRGEGGYVLVPPSPGYQYQHLDLFDVPTVTQEQADAMLEAARSLCRMPEPQEPKRPRPPRERSDDGPSVIEAFNSRYDPADVLARNGYKYVAGKWLAPNSSSGNPGVVIFTDGDTPRAFSHHADALSDGRAHDCFDIFRLLEHRGDWTRAVADAARELGLEQGGPSCQS